MAKYLKTAFLRDLEIKLQDEKISYGKMLELIQTEVIENYKKDNTLLKKIKKVLSEIWLGFKIAEENRHNSQWGKF
jgi:hypothetical protein